MKPRSSSSVAATGGHQEEASSATAAKTTEMTAFQVAYTMGSMGIKLKHTDTDNGYQGTDTSAENTEIAISFSF